MRVAIGNIQSIDSTAVAARVSFDDVDSLVSATLPILHQGCGAFQSYHLPNVGDQVVCLFLDDETEGFILGALYNEVDTPDNPGAGKWYINFPGGQNLTWNNGNLSIDADSINITGDLTITGDLQVTGDIQAGGSVQVGGTVTAARFIEA